MATYMTYRYRYEVRDDDGRLFGASKFRSGAEEIAKRQEKEHGRPMHIIDSEEGDDK